MYGLVQGGNDIFKLVKGINIKNRKLHSVQYVSGHAWNSRTSMRKMVKHLLKKYKYPPEGMEDAIQTVISQCEMWVDYEYSSEHASESIAKRAMSYFDAMSGKN